MIFQKVSARARLEALLDKQKAVVKRAFAAFVQEAHSEKLLREITRLLERGQVAQAMSLIDSRVEKLGRVIPKVFNTSGEAEVLKLAQQLASLTQVAISFDPGDSRAAALARQASLDFIQGFSTRQKEAIRVALSDAFAEGLGPRQAAKAFRDSIGLTGAQESAVRNYKRLLRKGSLDALTRDIRDRRFDSSVRGAAAEGKSLTAGQIDKMVERYRARYLMVRSETIARTESLRVASTARDEALRQTVIKTGLGPDEVERVWMATRDARTRDTHRAMNGQVVGMQQPFVSPGGATIMFPGDPSAPAEEVINCRCVVVIRIKPRQRALAA